MATMFYLILTGKELNQIKKQTLNYEFINFFYFPPSRKVLLKRQISRGEKNKEIIKMRMQQFEKDVLHWIDYDFVVVNEDLENVLMK